MSGEWRMVEVEHSDDPDRVEVCLLDGTVRVFEPAVRRGDASESGGAQ